MSQANDSGADAPAPEPSPAQDATGAAEPKVAAPDDVVTAPVEAPEITELRQGFEKARSELEQAQARLRAVSKAYNDLQAEMRAFKERMEARAKMDSELQAFDQVRAFFDPVMNLKRSVTRPGDDVNALVEGLKMVHHQFMESLRKLGLEEIAGEGATFDPRLHEALATAPVDDKALDGKVLQVHTAGYTVKGRVLQASQVVIGKHQETAGEA